MQKTVNIGWKVLIVIIIVLSLITSVNIYLNRDEIITSNVTMNYFVETVKKNDKDQIKSFVANSNNDVLYNNFVSTMDNVYHYDGVSDFGPDFS